LYKKYISFFCITFVWNIFAPINIWVPQDILIVMCSGVSVKWQIFLSDIKVKCILSTDVSETHEYKILWESVQRYSSCYRQMVIRRELTRKCLQAGQEMCLIDWIWKLLLRLWLLCRTYLYLRDELRIYVIFIILTCVLRIVGSVHSAAFYSYFTCHVVFVFGGSHK
jgi:hypothetical protein